MPDSRNRVAPVTGGSPFFLITTPWQRFGLEPR